MSLVAEEPSPVEAALKGLCPRCGARTLFAGFARFAPKCLGCGLDFAAFDVGDGPAAFLTLIVGTLITILAVLFELKFEPPWWVHVILWLPLILIAVLGSLRFAKGLMVALEYKSRSRAGRIGGE